MDLSFYISELGSKLLRVCYRDRDSDTVPTANPPGEGTYVVDSKLTSLVVCTVWCQVASRFTVYPHPGRQSSMRGDQRLGASSRRRGPLYLT
jgi:hypothetical protein